MQRCEMHSILRIPFFFMYRDFIGLSYLGVERLIYCLDRSVFMIIRVNVDFEKWRKCNVVLFRNFCVMFRNFCIFLWAFKKVEWFVRKSLNWPIDQCASNFHVKFNKCGSRTRSMCIENRLLFRYRLERYINMYERCIFKLYYTFRIFYYTHNVRAKFI